LGVGGWGYGVWVLGLWVWGIGPNPQSPIPNPQDFFLDEKNQN